MLTIPRNYRAMLVPETQEQAIKEIKDLFQCALANELRLRRVTAPLFVLSGTGINDDLNGIEKAVTFEIPYMQGATAEVVQSLAKWKRMKIAEYHIAAGYGIYTDMNAIRAHEEPDNIHSLYVDQWDWEQTINEGQRTVEYLTTIVRKIYKALRDVEQMLWDRHPHITPQLPEDIYFIHAQELLNRYPTLPPKEREAAIAQQYGAVFVIGIGADLSSGEPHDMRAPDYDDWTTVGQDGNVGLNGDIILWNDLLGIPFEISSMGIRVDRAALLKQLEIRGAMQRCALKYHTALLNGDLPYTIGGGIGQSRLCMYLLKAAHIGEVQSSIWPSDMRSECARNGIYLK